MQAFYLILIFENVAYLVSRVIVLLLAVIIAGPVNYEIMIKFMDEIIVKQYSLQSQLKCIII